MQSIAAGVWPFRCYVCGWETWAFGSPLHCPNCGAHIKERNKAALKALRGARTNENHERDVEHMARTQIAAGVRESLVNRLAIYLLSNQTTRIEQTVWTLETVGFDPDVVDGIMAEARKVSGVPDPDTTGANRSEPVAPDGPEKPAEPAVPKGRPVSPAPKPA